MAVLVDLAAELGIEAVLREGMKEMIVVADTVDAEQSEAPVDDTPDLKAAESSRGPNKAHSPRWPPRRVWDAQSQ